MIDIITKVSMATCGSELSLKFLLLMSHLSSSAAKSIRLKISHIHLEKPQKRNNKKEKATSSL